MKLYEKGLSDNDRSKEEEIKEALMNEINILYNVAGWLKNPTEENFINAQEVVYLSDSLSELEDAKDIHNFFKLKSNFFDSSEMGDYFIRLNLTNFYVYLKINKGESYIDYCFCDTMDGQSREDILVELEKSSMAKLLYIATSAGIELHEYFEENTQYVKRYISMAELI